jgi:hypothetical protein
MKKLAATYLLGGAIDGNSSGFINSLRKGRAVVSAGPVPVLTVHDTSTNRLWQVGDTLPEQHAHLKTIVEVMPGEIEGNRQLPLQDDCIVIDSNNGVLWQGSCIDAATGISLPSVDEIFWIRALLLDKNDDIVAFTNAIYAKSEM